MLVKAILSKSRPHAVCGHSTMGPNSIPLKIAGLLGGDDPAAFMIQTTQQEAEDKPSIYISGHPFNCIRCIWFHTKAKQDHQYSVKTRHCFSDGISSVSDSCVHHLWIRECTISQNMVYKRICRTGEDKALRPPINKSLTRVTSLKPSCSDHDSAGCHWKNNQVC